jgi:hypothetical protein
MTSATRTYEQNYSDLRELLGTEEYRRLEVEGFMPLSVEKLTGLPLVSLCQYGEKNGDPMRNPEVCFRLRGRAAQPVLYRNDYSGTRYLTAFNCFKGLPVEPHLQGDLDRFVSRWMEKLQEQGFFKRAQEQNGGVARERSRAGSTTGTTSFGNPEKTSGVTLVSLAEIESNNYTVAVYGRCFHSSQTWNYRTTVYSGEKNPPLYRDLPEHNLARVIRTAEANGVAWLSAKQAELGLPTPTAEQFQDCLNALKSAQALISRFAACGHEKVLQDPHLLAELGLSQQQQGAQQASTISRQR